MTDRAFDDIRYLPWEAKQAEPPNRPRRPRKPKLPPPLPRLTLLALEPHHCRWPILDNPTGFCGQPKQPGGHSYCADHVRIAHAKGTYR